MIKIALSFLGGFVVGILIIWGWNAYTNKTYVKDIKPTTTIPENMVATTTKDSKDTTTGNSSSITKVETKNIVPVANITVANQPSGNTVKVADVTLKKDGWIVVHEERNGLIANALGAVRKNAGKYKNITVPLLRNTVKNERYWIVLYSDNGDHQFNLKNDLPVKNADGRTIMNSFNTK